MDNDGRSTNEVDALFFLLVRQRLKPQWRNLSRSWDCLEELTLWPYQVLASISQASCCFFEPASHSGPAFQCCRSGSRVAIGPELGFAAPLSLTAGRDAFGIGKQDDLEKNGRIVSRGLLSRFCKAGGKQRYLIFLRSGSARRAQKCLAAADPDN